MQFCATLKLKVATLATASLLAASAAYGAEKSIGRDAFFELKIRPVLAGTCFKCHGGEKVNHGLRVDSRAALVRGGDSGPAIIPGEPDKSLLIQAIRHTHDEIEMPTKKKLTNEVLDDFASWIKDGADWPETKRGSAFPAKRHFATGFIALSRRYATAPFELMHLTVEDTIETTGRAFMGLTLRCARCHDHKYDPVTKEDYYALYGFFASTQYPYAGSEEFQSKNFNRSGFQPIVPPEESIARLEAFRNQIDRLQSELKHTEQEDPSTGRLAALKKQIEAKAEEIKATEEKSQNTDPLKQELSSLTKQRDETSKQLEGKLKPMREQLRNLQRVGLPPDVPGAYAVCDAKPVDTFVHIRGEPGDKGPVIKRGVPKFLSGGTELKIPDGASGRLELAQWLTRPEHPLTARVMVNRIWQHHFGKGIVATPSNFGLRGEEPTHPELLDYLAARFIESCWSIKAMHRLILLSKTYQLSSAYNDADAARDPGNKFYWRFDRRRLDAESIRDAMLSVTGNLDLSQPGEHPFPKFEDWHWTQHNLFKAVYESNHRGVYLMTQRIQRHPYLSLFDAPDANTSTDVRSESTVPLQALYLMNNPFVQNQAAALARHLIAAKNDVTQRIRLGAELTWSRPPRVYEIEKAVQFLNHYEQELRETGAATDKVELEAWTSYARVLLTANEFVYLD
ncbi:MAG: DUF1553 domain-containing protein [Verrucomicrobiota bacterium]